MKTNLNPVLSGGLDNAKNTLSSNKTHTIKSHNKMNMRQKQNRKPIKSVQKMNTVQSHQVVH